MGIMARFLDIMSKEEALSIKAEEFLLLAIKHASIKKKQLSFSTCIGLLFRDCFLFSFTVVE